jgi:hypothetical protein
MSRYKKLIKFILLVVLVFVLLLFCVYRISKSHTQEYLFSKGFLTSTQRNGGLADYVQAILILRETSFGAKWAEAENISEILTNDDKSSICNFVFSGSKAASIDWENNIIDVNVIVPKYGEFQLIEFSAMTRLTASFVVDDINSNHMDEACLLSTAVLAMGVQFSQTDKLNTQMIGVICKKNGLDLLEQCNMVLKERSLQRHIDEMKIEFLRDKIRVEDKFQKKIHHLNYLKKGKSKGSKDVRK